MGRARVALLAGLGLVVGGSGAHGETLASAIDDAYRTNPQLESQRAELRALDETVIQAASPYRLNVSVVGALDYQQQHVRNIIDRFQDFDQRNWSAVLSASQILSNGGRTASQVSAAEADVLSGRERLREVENFILLEVVDSYVSVRRDLEIVAIQERSVESYSRQVDQAQARERGGDLTRTDIAQAEAQRLIAETALAQARSTLETDRARFAAVVGHNPGELDVEPALPGLPPTIGEAYRAAEIESPTLQQAVLNERGAQDRVAGARAERRPIVEAVGTYGLTDPADYDTRNVGHVLTAGVRLTIPLLTAGVVDSQVRQAIETRQSLTARTETVRRAVDTALLNAWDASITARDQLDIGTQAVSAAEAALTGVKRSFAEGFRSNFEVLDSEQRLLDAQLIVANARYQRYTSQANLLAYLGRLEAAALQQQATVYNSAANLERRRHEQFGPFQTLLQPIDQALKPSIQSRDARPIPPSANPTIAPAAVPPPDGPLAKVLPVAGADPADAVAPRSSAGSPIPDPGPVIDPGPGPHDHPAPTKRTH